MNRKNYFIMDLKNFIREPLVLLMSLLPIIITGIFKIGIIFGYPLIQTRFGIDLGQYSAYFLAFFILITSELMGIVMGFAMLGDKDGNIIEWMQVTPLGIGGYLINRMGMVIIANAVYVVLVYVTLAIVMMPVYALVMVIVMSSLVAATVGLLLFVLATDKVKGLTWAKFLNIWGILVFADLLRDPWIPKIAGLFPTYWIGKVIRFPISFDYYFWMIIVSVGWFASILRVYFKKLNQNTM